jgi:hypothetical protein
MDVCGDIGLVVVYNLDVSTKILIRAGFGEVTLIFISVLPVEEIVQFINVLF